MKTKNLSLLSVVIAVALGTLPSAYAQQTDNELQTVEVIGKLESYFEDSNTTALKGHFLDDETPYQVSTVNQQLIEDVRASRLEDVFSYTTGVSRAGYLADGFVIRGYDIDLNNIKVNGMSGLTSRFGSPSTANVETIEVLKGPASVLYGNMETGGMVNMVTKLPQAEFAASLQLSTETYATNVSNFGSDNGVTGTLDVTGPLAGRDDLMYRFILTGDNLNSFRDGVSFKNYHLYPSLLWQIDPNTSLLMALEIANEEGTADHGLFAAQQDINTVAPINTVYQESDDYDNDKGVSFDAELTHNFSDDSEFHFKWRSVWHTDERSLYESNRVNNVDLSAGESIDGTTLRRRNRHQVNDRDWHSFDTYLSKAFNTGSVEHSVTVGLMGEYRMTDYDRKVFGGYASPNIGIYNPVHGGTATEKEGNRRKTQYYSGGFYLQDKIRFNDQFTLVASGRVNRTKIDFTCVRGSCNDDSTTKTTDVVGSLGGVFNVTDNLSLYANIAQSFDPYTAERLGVNGEALEAEKSQQYEVGIKYGIDDRLNVGLSAYRINKDNVSEKNGSYYETIGKVESKGVDLDVQWLPSDNWQIKAGYAYNDSIATEGSNKGLRTAHAPRNSAYAFTRYNLPQHIWGGELGFSLGLTYRDEVKTDISPKNSVTLPSYTTLDLGAYYEINDWKWALNMENATDKKYFYAGSDDERIYVGDPRKVTLTVTKEF